MANIVQGLRVYVYRNKSIGDCTNGGISSRYDTLILVGKGVEGPEIVDLDDPPENAAKLVRRFLPWLGPDPFMHIEPLDGKWYMAGGNIAYTSDSRFPSPYPLQIHDRTESTEEYLSND